MCRDEGTTPPWYHPDLMHKTCILSERFFAFKAVTLLPPVPIRDLNSTPVLRNELYMYPLWQLSPTAASLKQKGKHLYSVIKYFVLMVIIASKKVTVNNWRLTISDQF